MVFVAIRMTKCYILDMNETKLLPKPKLSQTEIAQRWAKIMINSRYDMLATSEFTLYNVEENNGIQE